MTNDLYKRFSHIKEAQERKDKQPNHLHVVPNQDLVHQFLNSETNHPVLDRMLEATEARYHFDFDTDVKPEEVSQLLEEIKASYDSERLTLLIDDCKSSVMDAIIKPFGLAGLIFEDQEGGNVDTVHNARHGVYATDANREKYTNRGEYNPDEYHKHHHYIEKNRLNSELKKNGQLKDAYSDNTFKTNDKYDLDHTVSAKSIHDDAGRVLAGLDGPDLANIDSNLNSTNRSVNRSKKADSVEDYIKKVENKSETRQEKIMELKNKGNLSEQEQKQLDKLQSLESIDVEKMKAADEQARQDIDKTINKTYYTSKEFTINLAKSSAVDGLKMGLQQALGILVREFALGVFAEGKDIFSRRKDIKLNGEFLKDLRERFERISKRVMSKWKDVVVAFKDGAISGFFSSLITVIINTFFTTGKRAVKMIREGFFSLFRAFKLLMIPSETMSKREAAHEATKLIASGLVVTGGIALEEVLEKALLNVPVIGAFSNILVPVILGIVTGLSMALMTYLIDKVDLFKVNADKRQAHVHHKLDEMIDERLEAVDDAIQYILNPMHV